jgi:ketosteroid isomerase-like protein
MAEPTILRFDTRAEFQRQLRAVLGRAQASLDLFDPDFALFPLGDPDVDAVLRRFLQGGGAAPGDARQRPHRAHYPRFLRLLREHGHRVECRVTHRGIRQLTDSFCIADGLHLVRRFHSDHLRGEAAFDAPQETDVPRERFAAIWEESQPGLHPTVTGL